MSTAIVDVTKLGRDGTEAIRKNATMYGRQTDLEAALVEIRAVRHTMSGQISATGERVATLKARSVEV